MDLARLGLFLDCVRHGSFAAAARHRGIDASAVSRAIAVLEADLGARLIERTTRRFALTEAGARFAARVAPLVDGMEDARDEMRDAARKVGGTLRVTASVAFGQAVLLPLLPGLAAAAPDLRIDLVLTDARVDLAEAQIDVGIRLGARVEPGLVGARLFVTRYRAVAAPDWCARHGGVGLPDPARVMRLLVPGFDRWRIEPGAAPEAGGGAELLVPAGSPGLTSPLVLRDAALAGLGAAILADWLVAGPLAEGRLVDLCPGASCIPEGTPGDTAAWIIYPSRAYLPRRVRLFIDHLRAGLRQGRALDKAAPAG